MAVVNESGVELQLRDVSLVDGILHPKSEIGCVALGNIVSYNTLQRQSIILGDWTRGQYSPVSLGSPALGWQTQIGPPEQGGEGGEGRRGGPTHSWTKPWTAEPSRNLSTHPFGKHFSAIWPFIHHGHLTKEDAFLLD